MPRETIIMHTCTYRARAANRRARCAISRARRTWPTAFPPTCGARHEHHAARMRTARSRRAQPGRSIATGRARSPSCRAHDSRRHSRTVSANARPVARPARQRLSHARATASVPRSAAARFTPPQFPDTRSIPAGTHCYPPETLCQLARTSSRQEATRSFRARTLPQVPLTKVAACARAVGASHILHLRVVPASA